MGGGNRGVIQGFVGILTCRASLSPLKGVYSLYSVAIAMVVELRSINVQHLGSDRRLKLEALGRVSRDCMGICGIKNSSSSSFQLLLHLLPRFFLPEQAVGPRVYSFGCRVYSKA